MLRRLLPLAFVLVLAAPGAAQPVTGNCSLGRAEAYLDANDVRAKLFNHGNLFWDGDPNVYTVPKELGVNAVFNAGLWIGGKVGGELRVAGARYDNYEFWPGPLLEDGSLPNPGDCSDWDRIWTVSVLDVERYERTGEATADLAEWPAHLGAPVVDGDGVAENYDLAAGDRPLVYGAQTAWWVMNDVGNEHREMQTPPLGVEVRVAAFAPVGGVPALDQATFYRYEILYRGAGVADSVLVSFYMDPDLGREAGDDYIGSDSLRGLGFVYNGDNEDLGGYGEAVPALGVKFFEGDAHAFVYYNSGGTATGDPGIGPEYYHVMNGHFRLGAPVTYGEASDRPGNPPTRWVYTARPGAYWSEPCPTVSADGECGASIAASDRRFVFSRGPHRLAPGDTLRLTVGVLWARGACSWDCAGSSVDALYAAADAAQAAYDAGMLLGPQAAVTLSAPALSAPADGAVDLGLRPGLHWTPVPGATRYTVEVAADPGFRTVAFVRTIRETAVVAELPDGGPFYWRVRAEASGALSPWSDTRSFSQYAPVRAGLVAFAGGLAAVEVAGPAGADPCGPGAVSPDGCDVLGANLVYESPNSTGEWLLQEMPLRYPDSPFLSGDLEVRFTEAGSVAFYAGNPLPQSRFVRVPFEVWDTGRAAGPDDDRQLVASFGLSFVGYGEPPESDPCQFAFGEGDFVRVGDVSYPSTDAFRVVPYRSGPHNYADWAALAADSLAGQDCALVGPALGSANHTLALSSFPRPIFRFVAQETTREMPGEGTVVRVVGNKPGVVDLALTADLSALEGASDVRIAVDPAAGVTDADLAAALDGLALAEHPVRPGLYAATARAAGAVPPISRGVSEPPLPRSAVFRLVVDGRPEPLDRVLTLSGLEPDIDLDGVAERAERVTYGAAEPAGPWTAAPSARSAVVAGRAVAADYAARAGDVVAAFDAVGRVAGAAPVAFVPDGEGGARPVVWLRLYGDDPATAEDEGLTDGEAFTLRLASFRNGGVRGTEPLGPWSDTGGAPLPGLGDPSAELAFPVVLAVEEESVPEPVSWRLEPPYPNPSRGTVRVPYALSQAGEARLEVFDVLGRRVAVLAEGRHEAGPHAATWEAGSVASGVYVVRLAGGGTARTRKVAVVR